MCVSEIIPVRDPLSSGPIVSSHKWVDRWVGEVWTPSVIGPVSGTSSFTGSLTSVGLTEDRSGQQWYILDRPIRSPLLDDFKTGLRRSRKGYEEVEVVVRIIHITSRSRNFLTTYLLR